MLRATPGKISLRVPWLKPGTDVGGMGMGPNATVEARHASYLNNLNGGDPFPDAFDTPLTQEEVLAAAGGFIVAGNEAAAFFLYPRS